MNRIEDRKTKAGNGTILAAGFEVIKGDFEGRLIFHNFIVEHTNPKAAEIGTDQLDKYLQAIGLAGGFEGLGYDRSALENYTELPLKVIVNIQEGNGTFNASNRIVKFTSRL